MARPILKKILWSILAVIGAFALLVGWTVSQLPRMSKVPRLEAAPGVVGVETAGSYVWIIRTAHGVALIDAGMDAKGKAILQELDREHLNSANVNTIFVTHGHRDHIGALLGECHGERQPNIAEPNDADGRHLHGSLSADPDGALDGYDRRCPQDYPTRARQRLAARAGQHRPCAAPAARS